MPSTKTKSQKQIIAGLLVDADVSDGTPVYLVKVPRFSEPHVAVGECNCLKCHPIKSTLKMYGVEFTEGVGLTTDLELAQKITAEFPEYTFEELK